MDRKYGRKFIKCKSLPGHRVAKTHFEKTHKRFIKWFGYAWIGSTIENLKNAKVCRVIVWQQPTLKKHIKDLSSGLCMDLEVQSKIYKCKSLPGHNVTTTHFEKSHKKFLKWFMHG